MTILRPAALAVGLVAVAVAATIDVRKLGLETSDPQLIALALSSLPACWLAAWMLSDRRAWVWSPALAWLTVWVAAGFAGGALSGRPLVAVVATGVFAVSAVSTARLVRGHGWPPLLGVVVSVAVAHGGLGVTARVLGRADVFSPERRLVLLAFEPNHLARIAALGALAAIALALPLRRPSWHISMWPIAGVCALAVVLTGSRTGAVALGVGMVVPLVKATNRRVALVGVAIGMFAVSAVGFTGLAGPAIDRVSRSADRSLDDLRTATGRTELWPAIVSTSLERPVLGHGHGSDFGELAQIRADGGIGWDAEHTHSLALHALLTTGTTGLVAFLAAAAFMLQLSWRRRDPWPLALFLAVAVDGLSEAVLSTAGPAWFVLAAAATPAATQRRRNRRSGDEHPGFGRVAPSIGRVELPNAPAARPPLHSLR